MNTHRQEQTDASAYLLCSPTTVNDELLHWFLQVVDGTTLAIHLQQERVLSKQHDALICKHTCRSIGFMFTVMSVISARKFISSASIAFSFGLLCSAKQGKGGSTVQGVPVAHAHTHAHTHPNDGCGQHQPPKQAADKDEIFQFRRWSSFQLLHLGEKDFQILRTRQRAQAIQRAT